MTMDQQKLTEELNGFRNLEFNWGGYDEPEVTSSTVDLAE